MKLYGIAPSVALRRPPAGGPVAALTVHWTVIHSCDCASLTPIPYGTGELLRYSYISSAGAAVSRLPVGVQPKRLPQARVKEQ